jgi:DNA gyrase subunit B
MATPEASSHHLRADTMEGQQYTASNIQVLDGLTHVRTRPGMYIGDTSSVGLHHLLWEIVDNAVDEAMNGYASTIEVTLHEDGCSATVSDNGRGIPVDMHPTEKRSTLEVIFTTLYSGGKFDQSSYMQSGGLHGVGASVVNALSTTLIATVKRAEGAWSQEYSRGQPVAPVAPIENGRGTGTTVFFRPDVDIFESTTFDAEIIAERLEIKTYLLKGLRILFRDRVNDAYYEYKHEGGLLDYLEDIQKQEKYSPIQEKPFHLELINGTRLEVALQWTDHSKEHILTFVNSIPTRDGGTHEQGFRDGVVKAVRSYIDTHDLTPRGIKLTTDDIREGLVGLVSVFMAEPQFQGQTKGRLNTPEIRTLVGGAMRTELELFLNHHTNIGHGIAERIIQAARARKASYDAIRKVKRKTPVSRRLNLPGKLADCSSSDPEECEIFIVEGDSAGGSAKQGRDRQVQAILPLRGKVLNAHQATAAKVMQNRELQDVVSALGCGLGDALDPSKLRYAKVILLMDADSDGHHITTLLLTFFFRYMRQLIDGGFVYIAQPPLYRVNHAKKTWWALTDRDKDRIIAKVKKKTPNAKIDIQRFKGLGEMMPKTLYETTLDPDTRRLLRVEIPDGARVKTDRVIDDLMGRDVSARYNFIVENAANVDDLDV